MSGHESPFSREAWLKRLAFPLFMIGFVLFWRGQREVRAGDPSFLPYLWILAAVACVVVGSVGIRLKHAKRPGP